MFASLNLQLLTSATPMEPGSDPRADGDAPFLAVLETQLSFADSMELTAVIPVSADAGSGEVLPDGGKALPPINTEATPLTVPFAIDPALRESTATRADATADETPIAAFDVDLDIEYPPSEMAVIPPPQAPLQVPPVQLTPKPGLVAAAASSEYADATTPLAADKPLPPVETLRQARPWVGSPDWVAKSVEAAPVIPTAAQALQSKTGRSVAEVPTIVATVATATDGDPAIQEMPVVVPLHRSGSAIETIRQADTRVTGVKAPATATPLHIAATFSQFAGEATNSRSDSSIAPIATPVRDSIWGEKLGERVMMLASNQIKSAEIRLTPADLGPLRIHVQMDDNSANVTFHAQHAVTREAIEQALPRLREMLAESGLSLGQTNVSDRNTSGDNGKNDGAHRATTMAGGDDLTDSLAGRDAPARQKSVTIDGLIDTFA